MPQAKICSETVYMQYRAQFCIPLHPISLMHLLILPCPASTLPCNPRMPCLFHSAARSQQSQFLIINYLIKNQLQTDIPLLLWPYFKAYDLPLHFNSICLSKDQCCEPSCLPGETAGF